MISTLRMIALVVLMTEKRSGIRFPFSDNSIDSGLKELLARVMNTQVLESKNYTPPVSWAQKKGLFECNFRIMLSGGPMETEFRSSYSIYDNNMFVTGW
jgi:hypothetical protein